MATEAVVLKRKGAHLWESGLLTVLSKIKARILSSASEVLLGLVISEAGPLLAPQ